MKYNFVLFIRISHQMADMVIIHISTGTQYSVKYYYLCLLCPAPAQTPLHSEKVRGFRWTLILLYILCHRLRAKTSIPLYFYF